MLIGLTGGMGSGKSTAADILLKENYGHIDADRISRIVCQKGSGLLDELAECFGASIINRDGSLNRKLLADIAFSQREKTELLNKLVQSAILDYSLSLYESIKKEKGEKYIVIFDVPLLFEAGWDRYCDRIITVTADTAVRVERIKKRDGLSEEDIMKRISIQMPEAEKIKRSDFVLDNSSDLKALNEQIKKLLENPIFSTDK